MRVHVDDARRHHQAFGVDDALCFNLAEASDTGNAAILHGDIRLTARQTRTVDQQAVLDDKIVHRFLPNPLPDYRLSCCTGSKRQPFSSFSA